MKDKCEEIQEKWKQLKLDVVLMFYGEKKICNKYISWNCKVWSKQHEYHTQ